MLHTIEMGDATACWIANTLNVLFHKAVALASPISAFRASSPLSAKDLGLVEGHIPRELLEPYRFAYKAKNNIPEAHQGGLPFATFRLGFDPSSDVHGVFMDDSIAACEDHIAMIQETKSSAKKANFVHSEIEFGWNEIDFCGKRFFKQSWEIGLPSEKWDRIEKLQTLFNSQNFATGHQITSFIGLIMHISDIFPDIKAEAVECAWWSGIFGRLAHSTCPEIVKKNWGIILKNEFIIPDSIRQSLNGIIKAKWKKRSKVINHLLSPLDTFLAKDLNPTDKEKWIKALKSQKIHEITRVAAELMIVAFVFSIDSTPAYGPGCVSHSWGPLLSKEEQSRGLTRRKPGDHFAMDWRFHKLFQKMFAKNSSGFELVGKSLCLNHWWFKQAKSIRPRAAHLGAKAVFLVFGDNTGAVSIFQREKSRKHVLGPCHSIDAHRQNLNTKIFCIHLAGKQIPADHPSRMDQTGWKSRLFKSLNNLGLDPKRQGRRVEPPPGWKESLDRMLEFQENYRKSIYHHHHFTKNQSSVTP